MAEPLRVDEPTRRSLMDVACAALVGKPFAAEPGPSTPMFGGVFVSLHLGAGDDRTLRGCMGTLACGEGLLSAVAHATVAAATSDPRFAPVEPDEVRILDVEISVLSPLQPAAVEQVELGRHGVCVSRGGRRALLLPQVAAEHGWDRDTFLAQACLKAGLAPDAWHDGATLLEVFTAEVFGGPGAGPVEPNPTPA